MGDTTDPIHLQWEEMFKMKVLTAALISDYFQNNGGSFMRVQPMANSDLGEQLRRNEEQADPEKHGNVFLAGNYLFDEESARLSTIKPIELFICGPNPDEYLQEIKQTDTMSSVCGRVFKIGEPTFSCRECSMDPTCVLCSFCFKKSTHRSHKYKMGTSGGGGCCDCGDTEAWKKDPFCEEHDSICDETQPREQKASLSDEVMKRCEVIFAGVLHYCMQTLQVNGTGSLPELDDDDNTHCTILYNDETHTFEQVIQTLTSIVKCHQKTAIEYVTSIDREGRAVVKCASFEVCKKLKEDIENKAMRSSQVNRVLPLKVTVMHRSEVGCQLLAMQLLGWFQEFLTKHSSFRSVFAETIMKPNVPYHLKHILSNDHNLWKSARSCWHRLLISGLLIEYGNKKILALTFTKLYTSLMQDFIRDDHYHSFSVVSLSVQLFTVPTIAHYLIEQESAFFKLMHTYFAEAIEKHVKNRQLVFAKNTSTMNGFKRAAYILIDLKYLLSFKPERWTQELRKGFLHGVQLLIRLLKYMQGMDAVTRQIGQHMEYEQEWETAFTLHLKLSHLITRVLEWCATDRIVLVKVYRMVLAALADVRFIVHESERVLSEVSDHTASCLTYDVLSKPVSVHLPLTRFLAGLYVEIEPYGLAYDTIAPSVAERPSPEQIIEPVLCARTMMSQVHAGMWRRNGYALINQLFFYRNVKCRYEMLDRDIVILQMGASLIESNEFIIHVLKKYDLIGWLESDQLEKPVRAVDSAGNEDDYIRQTGVLVEEFLELLIVIVGERYVAGVGDVTENERIKKEIVQQLCIKPHSHSELARALNEDNCSEITIESVIDDVAVFEKPNAAEKKGVYTLKPMYYRWYNLYFYHYSKEEKSKSEEAQRNRQKENNELVCCPPPQLPKLTQSFSIIPNLLQCDIMLDIVRAILTRALDLKSISFTEGQLQRVLHLIGYAFQEEETGFYPYLYFFDRSQKINLLLLLEKLAKSPRVESQRDLLRWVIQCYKAMEAKQGYQAESSGSVRSPQDASESEEEKVNPQRSKLVAMRQAQILAQMANAQKVFMSSNLAMFEGVEDERGSTAPNVDDDVEMELQAQPVCLGANRQTARHSGAGSQRYTCILCSEKSLLATNNGTCLVYAAFVQRSSVLSRYQQTDERGQLQLIETKTHPSPHITTCGHVMHNVCFEKYFSNEVVKEHRRPYRNRAPILFDIVKREFLCPLCRFLSNCLLPLVPPLEVIMASTVPSEAPTTSAALQSTSIAGRFNFPFWYSFMSDFVTVTKEEQKRHQTQVAQALQRDELPRKDNDSSAGQPESTVGGESEQMMVDDLGDAATRDANDEQERDGDETEDESDYNVLGEGVRHHPDDVLMNAIVRKLEDAYDVPLRTERAERIFDGLSRASLRKFSAAIAGFTTLPVTAKRFGDDLACWLACSYTIRSLEMLLRVMGRPLGDELSIRYSSCLRGLVRVACVLGTIVPSRVLHTTMMRYMVDLYETLFGHKASPAFFEWDLFGILCTCLFATRSVLFGWARVDRIPKGDTLDHSIVQAVFLVNMLRTIITSSAECDGEQREGGKDEMETKQADGLPLNEAAVNLLLLYRKYNIHQQAESFGGANVDVDDVANRRLCSALLRDIRAQSQTLLRCCCLLFHSITDIELPQCSTTDTTSEHEQMVNYLGLQADPLSYFSTGEASLTFIDRLAHGNAEQIERMRQARHEQLLGGLSLFQAAPPVRRLIVLPEDYSDLINSVSLFTCPNNIRDDSRNPTMCLVCGEILCSQSFCCQRELDNSSVGSCTFHTAECGAGIGMFLRIRDAEILLLGIDKGCFIPAPYLDEYGETDQGLRRGNPLRLCQERYRKLHLVWLSHGLHEEITRRNETQQTLFATQWQNL